MNGLLFDDFSASPPWKETANAPELVGKRRHAFAARRVYAASMGLTGPPAAQWRSEAAMVIRGFAAQQKRTTAEVRRREGGGVRRGSERHVSVGLREMDAEALLSEADGSK